MKRSYEVGFVLATAAAGLGMTACADSQPRDAVRTVCVGLDFATPKGGPGSVEMEVIPKFNRNFGDGRVMILNGTVIAGNDSGEPVRSNPEFNGTGEFTFNWNKQNSTVQSDRVSANVEFQGANYVCPDTTVRFNPITYTVAPHPAGSPF